MGDTQDTTSDIRGERSEGLPTRSTGPASDRYEFGTLTGVDNTGQYKVFDGAFAQAPQVVLVGIDMGSRNLYLAGTPATGSFQAKVDGAGNFDCHYLAYGGP